MVNRLLRIFAVLLIALGLLWSLQGAGLVHVKPIACVANCTELQGASAQWLVTGLVTIAAGGGLWYFARRRRAGDRNGAIRKTGR
jgi:hypothetical protein